MPASYASPARGRDPPSARPEPHTCVWREDLFKLFKGLLASAPWIFVRANHDSCERAGEGTSAFSIRAPLPASCSIYTNPNALSIGSLQLITSIRHLPATVLSGHAHTFKLYSLSPARAPEVVVGNSGDSLAATPGIPLIGATVGTSTVTNATPVEGFGFATGAPAANGGWTILAKDSTSATTATCTMQPTLINCTK